MTLTIRPATEGELRLVHSSWRHQMRPRYRDTEPMGPEMRGHPWGRGRFISQGTASEMFRLYVQEHATTDQVLVAAMLDGTEAIGWASRSLEEGTEKPVCVVHHVYVLDKMRHEGVGARLLRHIRQESRVAGVACVPGTMNSAGVGLWSSEKSQ